MPDDDGDDLRLTLPLAPLAGIRGFVPATDLGVLAAVAEAGWFATPAAAAADPTVRQVELGILAVRPGADGGRETLVDNGGTVLVRRPATADLVGGDGVLGALRRAAQAAGAIRAGLAPGARAATELAGWIHDGRLPGLERALVLVYRVGVPAGCPAPAGSAWVSARGLAGLPLAAACRAALAALP